MSNITLTEITEPMISFSITIHEWIAYIILAFFFVHIVLSLWKTILEHKMRKLMRQNTG